MFLVSEIHNLTTTGKSALWDGGHQLNDRVIIVAWTTILIMHIY